MPTKTSEQQPAEPKPEESTQTDHSVWGLVVGVSLISTGLAAYEIVPASVTPLIRDSLNIGPTFAGLVVGVMFGTAVVASLPVGVVLDRTDSRTAIAAAVVVLLLAGSWGWGAGKSGEYWQVLASRALGGVAYVIVWNAGIDIVSRAVNSAQRATAVGVFTASGPIGFALGQGTGPLIAARFGWPAIFLAFTGFTLAGLLLFWPMSRGHGVHDGDAPSVADFGAVLRSPNVWIVGILGFLGYSVYLFVNSWGSSYLTEELGFPLAVGGLLIAVFPAVGVVARVSGGLLSDRVLGGRRQPIVLGSFAVAALPLLTFTQFDSLFLLVVLLLLTGFAIQLILGLSFTYIREVVDSHVAATAVAFQTSIGLSGAFIAPIIGGIVIDLAGFDAAFVLAGGLTLCGIAAAWHAPEPAA